MKSSAASSTRFAYIDALKILSMYAVVLLHTSAMGTYDVQGSSWHGFILLNAATRFAVPLFVMCSGAMLLQPASSAEHPLHFLRRRFLRVLLPFLVWSLAYEAQAIYLGAAKDLAAILLDFLYLTVRYHLWFVYMILALYLLTPLLRSALAALKTRELHYGMMIWLFFSLLVSVEYLTTADYWHTGTIFFFPEFVGYFIAGWILHTGRLMEKRISWLALPASVAAIIATAAYLVIHTSKNGLYENFFEGYFILFVIGSLLIFHCFRQWEYHFRGHDRIKFLLAKLSACTYGGYLVHILFLDGICRLFLPHGIYAFQHPLWIVLLLSLTTFAASLSVAALFRQLPLLRHLV